jgi:excisionase family DNA binding protein
MHRLRTADEGLQHASSRPQRSIAVGDELRAAGEAATSEGDLQLVSLSDAARFLCVSRGTLYDLLRTGQLASVHIGRLRRIPLGELRRFVAARLETEQRRDARG